MLRSLNQKICPPNAKLKCDVAHLTPNPKSNVLITSLTIVFRYLFPFIIGAVFINPIVGLVSIFYPFSQLVPYFYIYEQNTVHVTLDYVLFYGSLVLMLLYYTYMFREVGAYALLQIFSSLIMSLLMYFVGSDLSWGVLFLIVNIFVTIWTDTIVIKSLKKV